MGISVSDIIALKRSLDVDRKRIQKREEALAIVEEMLREQAAEQPDQELRADDKQLMTQPDPSNPIISFTEAVREAIHQFKGEQFSSTQIMEAIKGSNVSPVRNPRSMISGVLGELAGKKVIVLTKRGSGVRPNRYRVAPRPNGSDD